MAPVNSWPNTARYSFHVWIPLGLGYGYWEAMA